MSVSLCGAACRLREANLSIPGIDSYREGRGMLTFFLLLGWGSRGFTVHVNDPRRRYGWMDVSLGFRVYLVPWLDEKAN